MCKPLNILLLAFLCLSLCGCVSFPAVGVFENHNEVLYGTVKADLFKGKSDFELKGLVSGMECTGSSTLTHFSENPCKGQRGQIFGQCNDGRSILGKWIGTSCKSGYGFGKDTYDNSFTFTFGMEEEKAKALFQTHLKFAAQKPALPVYFPGNKIVNTPEHRLGTAFYISNQGHLLTAFNLIENAKKIRVRDFYEQIHDARVVVADPVNNLAIIKVELKSEYLHVDYETSTPLGDDIAIIAYHSLLHGPKISSGHVNSLSGIDHDIRFIQVDIPAHSGNAGAPLLTKDGRVVGVLSAVHASKFKIINVSQAMKTAYILPLAKSAGIQSEEGPAPLPLNYEELMGRFQRSVVLVMAQ